MVNCEEAIIAEKARFGRVRKTFMEYLREEYGRHIADRALWRVNGRRSKRYFRKNNPSRIAKPNSDEDRITKSTGITNYSYYCKQNGCVF
ncbi:MAG: hypothetical protein QXW37_06405 [Candidatus Nitrosotenuis sp.]